MNLFPYEIDLFLYNKEKYEIFIETLYIYAYNIHSLSAMRIK